MDSPGRRSWLDILSFAIALALLVWVLREAALSVATLQFPEWGWRETGLTTLSTLLYASTGVSAALIGFLLLRSSAGKVPLESVVSAYLISQLGKYLPGNVAHHLGRVVLLRRLGFAVPRVINVMILENLWALGVAAAIGVFALSNHAELTQFHGLSDFALPVALGLAVVFLFAPYLFRDKLYRLLSGSQRERRRVLVFELPQPWLAISSSVVYSLGYAVMGAVLLVIGSLFDHQSVPSVFSLAGLYALAWVIGFVTPGAPAGLGVREAVLLAGLSPMVGDSAAMQIVFLRLVTIMGDLLLFLLGSLIAQRSFRLASMNDGIHTAIKDRDDP